MGTGASVEKEVEPELKETDLTEEEKARVAEVVKRATNETLEQIQKERSWKLMAEELKPKLKARKFSSEKPEKTVLFISDGIQSWPVAANGVKEDVITLSYDAKEQHTLSDDLVKAFKEAEIPEASLSHFGWMFHGSEMTGEHKEANLKFLAALKPYLAADARVDILACELVAGETGMKVFKELEKESGINLAASTDLTGNTSAGGNWIMETDGVDVKNTYFTEKIDAFNETLLGYALHRKMVTGLRKKHGWWCLSGWRYTTTAAQKVLLQSERMTPVKLCCHVLSTFVNLKPFKTALGWKRTALFESVWLLIFGDTRTVIEGICCGLLMFDLMVALSLFSHPVSQEDVYVFTADQKRPIEDAERRACVVISTYSMLGFTGRRGGDTAPLGLSLGTGGKYSKPIQIQGLGMRSVRYVNVYIKACLTVHPISKGRLTAVEKTVCLMPTRIVGPQVNSWPWESNFSPVMSSPSEVHLRSASTAGMGIAGGGRSSSYACTDLSTLGTASCRHVVCHDILFGLVSSYVHICAMSIHEL